jgi:hypothetical protein
LILLPERIPINSSLICDSDSGGRARGMPVETAFSEAPLP